MSLKRLIIFLLGTNILSLYNPTFSQDYKQIIALQKKLNHSAEDTNRVMDLLAMAYCYSDASHDSARYYLVLADKLATQLHYAAGLADKRYMEGIVLYSEGKIDEAGVAYREALKMEKAAGREDKIASILTSIGLVYRSRGEHAKSIPYFKEAIAISERLGDKQHKARTLPKLANVYNLMGEPEQSIRYLTEARKIFFETGDSNSAAETLGSIGFTYQSMHQYDTAIMILKKAIQEFKSLEYYSFIPIGYTEIGKTYLLMERYDEALTNLKEAENWYKKNEVKTHQDALNNYLGQTLVKLHRFAEARPYIDKGLLLAQQEGDLEMMGDAYSGFSDFYKEQGDYKNALMFHEKYMAIRDTVNQKFQFDQLAEITTKYETEKKDKQIAEQQFSLTRRNYLLAGGLLLFVFSGLLAFNYYKRYTLKKEQQLQVVIMHQQDLATKAILNAEEEERKRIAIELHDGVGQMISAARLNLSALMPDLKENDQSKLRFEKITSLVDEGCRELRTVSHNMMPNALLKRGLAHAIGEFIDRIDHRLIDIELHSEGLNERIDPDIETVLYRVVQECVNNVIKHSGANRLDISLLKEDDLISITIEDNGCGFEINKSNENEGMGLKNIQARVKYLKGKVEFDSKPGHGTVVAIYIPTAA